jgi:hypothetical protein
MMVELPYDIWSVIINHLTIDETSKEIRYIKLAFISSVSKQTNIICNKLKRQLDISTKAKPAKFQEYFASKGYLSCIIYAHENRCLWDKYTCSAAALQGHLEGRRGEGAVFFRRKWQVRPTIVVSCIVHKKDPSPSSWGFHPMPQTADDYCSV